VTGAIVTRLGEAWALCAGLQAVLWLVSLRTRNAGIVDVGWALLFTAVVGLFAATSDVPLAAWAPIGAIIVVWSVRLGGYLIARGAATGPEEGRYRDLRARWQPHANRRFFVFFQAQAALVALLATAFVVPFVSAARTPALQIAGAALSSIGVIGEAVADAQLARWKRARIGPVCEVGLWGYSRHPNYFFEWCVWLGHAVYGLAFGLPWGLLGLVGQAIIVGSIFGVTGIPPTEAQALRSKGDAYRAYQARISRFIPLPPKRARP
jgi:steroid 5-alpha reductase family enzyme